MSRRTSSCVHTPPAFRLASWSRCTQRTASSQALSASSAQAASFVMRPSRHVPTASSIRWKVCISTRTYHSPTSSRCSFHLPARCSALTRRSVCAPHTSHMVDPNVLELCGIDSKEYSGYAFGMGVERITNLKYRVSDLRMFSENDTRFLEEFEAAN